MERMIMTATSDVTDDVIRKIAADPVATRRVLELAGLMTMDAIARRLQISYYRVKMLRATRLTMDTNAYLDGTCPIPRMDALPTSLPIPGDPLWHPEDIEMWGRQTGRLDEDGRPQRARPTGRPRRSQRFEESADRHEAA